MAMAALIVAGAASAYSAYEKHEANEANATEAQKQSAFEQAKGDLAAEQEAILDRRQRGATIAAYGASGVSLSGSPLDALADQAIQGALKAQMARLSGQMNAQYYISRASQFQEGAQAAVVGGLLNTASTVLTSKYVQDNHG